MFLIFRFNYVIFRDLNKTSKGKRPANPPEMARNKTESERKNATRPGVTESSCHPNSEITFGNFSHVIASVA